MEKGGRGLQMFPRQTKRIDNWGFVLLAEEGLGSGMVGLGGTDCGAREDSDGTGRGLESWAWCMK